MKNGKRIHKVVVRHIEDDLQHEQAQDTLGTFDNEPKSEYAIEVEFCRGYRYEGYRYFNGPVENYKGAPPEEIREYVAQDYERMKEFNAGEWSYVGVMVEAEIQTTPFGPIQTISSGGLWGIESDSDKEYLKSIEDEELASLRIQLEAVGFSKRAITAAFRDVEHD